MRHVSRVPKPTDTAVADTKTREAKYGREAERLVQVEEVLNLVEQERETIESLIRGEFSNSEGEDAEKAAVAEAAAAETEIKGERQRGRGGLSNGSKRGVFLKQSSRRQR